MWVLSHRHMALSSPLRLIHRLASSIQCAGAVPVEEG